jgi:hypothetical protein
VLAHWNNSPQVDKSLHAETSPWFRTNQSLFLLFNTACLLECIPWWWRRLITVRVLMWPPNAKLPRNAPAVLNGRCRACLDMSRYFLGVVLRGPPARGRSVIFPVWRKRCISRTMNVQEAVQTIPWPARSPDMNPIQYVWDFIGQKINNAIQNVKILTN